MLKAGTISFKNELLVNLAGRYKKSVAQIILRWFTQRGVIVIPESVNKERIAQNYNIFDFELSAEDILSQSGVWTRRRVYFSIIGTRKSLNGWGAES